MKLLIEAQHEKSDMFLFELSLTGCENSSFVVAISKDNFNCDNAKKLLQDFAKSYIVSRIDEVIIKGFDFENRCITK